MVSVAAGPAGRERPDETPAAWGSVRRWRSLVLTRPVRALPVRVGEVPGETHESLVRRLAAANHLPVDALHRLVQPRLKHPVDVATLAALAGLPAERLCRDGGSRQPRWACRACMFGRGIRTPVVVEVDGPRGICRRHRRWLGAPRPWPAPEVDLRAVPDVLVAHRRHRRLARRRHNVAEQAFASAAGVVADWAERGQWWTPRDSRLQALTGERPDSLPIADPRRAVANYPEAVALAEVLSDPATCGRKAWPSEAGFVRFCDQVEARLRIPYRPDRHDALVEWILHRKQWIIERERFIEFASQAGLPASLAGRPTPFDVLWGS
jgi:hypothetical protein